MASQFPFSICALLTLKALGERMRLNGDGKAAAAIDCLATAMVVLLPVVTTAAWLVVAPGYLHSMAADSAGIWAAGTAIVVQIAINFSIKKIIDLSFQKIGDRKV